jgi:hypothetical protein
VKSKTAERIALVLITLATILSVIGAIDSDSIALATMVLLVFGLALNLRTLHRQRGKDGAASPSVAVAGSR